MDLSPANWLVLEEGNKTKKAELQITDQAPGPVSMNHIDLMEAIEKAEKLRKKFMFDRTYRILSRLDSELKD
jgi:hypothetical protein